jgi:predicted DNA-binding transcriptional regulator YafY
VKSRRVSRVVEILATLQSGRNYTASQLAKIFGTSRRTIYRDLKELESIGVSYHYDATTGGYTMEPEFFLPPVDLKLQEAMSLLLLVHKASEQLQMPFKNSALLAALKIENNLPAKIRQHCNRALQSISTRAPAQAPMRELDKTFAQLQEAIAKKQKVSMRYHSLFEGQDIALELCPYHLVHNQRAWYTVGLSSIHNGVRTFKLARIRQLQTLSQHFVDDGNFDLSEYLGRAWSMIPEGRLYNVKLRFLPKVAENVAEVQWHSTQKVTHNEDGSVTMEFRVDGLGEITWWILGYGDQVQVLQPKKLRQKIAEIAKNMAKLNSQI